MKEKLLEIQQKLKAPKNQKNSFGGYNYRSCEDILEAVKPLLKEQGLLLRLDDELVQIGERYYIKATAIISDGKEEIRNTSYAREEETKKGMDGSQITGASSSYARKYALNGLFLIDDVKDSDTTNTGVEVTEEYAKNYVFEFGKHKGKKLIDLIKSEDSYIEWLLKNESTSPDILKSIEILTGRKPTEIDLDLDMEFQRVLVDSGQDLDKLLEHYGVKKLEQLTTEQRVEAIGIMKKKIEMEEIEKVGKNG